MIVPTLKVVPCGEIRQFLYVVHFYAPLPIWRAAAIRVHPRVGGGHPGYFKGIAQHALAARDNALLVQASRLNAATAPFALFHAFALVGMFVGVFLVTHKHQGTGVPCTQRRSALWRYREP